MREVELGGLKVRITGGSDRQGGGDGPVVVLMHGFGAPGTDLVSLWRVLDAPEGTRFVFPEAPIELDTGMGVSGRAWWMIDVEAIQRAMMTGQERDLSKGMPDGLPHARDLATAMLDALQHELGVSGERMIIGGFSQGAMLACDIALTTDRSLAGLVLMSGTLVSQDEWKAGALGRKGLEVLQSHGRQDPLLPFAAAERLRDLLRDGGLAVEWVPFNGQHTIGDAVVDGVGKFAHRVLS